MRGPSVAYPSSLRWSDSVSLDYLLPVLVLFLYCWSSPCFSNLGYQPSVAFAWIHLGPILRWCSWPKLGPWLLEVSCLHLISAHVSCSCCYCESFSFITLFFMVLLKLFPRGERHIWQSHRQSTRLLYIVSQTSVSQGLLCSGWGQSRTLDDLFPRQHFLPASQSWLQAAGWVWGQTLVWLLKETW